MIPDEVIARLKAALDCPFAIVEGASELAAIVDQPLATPAAYVIVKEEASGENERVNGVLQRTEMDIGVVIVADNLSDASGAAASVDLEALKRFVRGRLIGWQPASAEDVLLHVGGQLVKARNGALWWEMTLSTAVYLTDEA